MENRRNYYRVLQVQPGAPVEIIRASYRTLMQRLRVHPDLGGDHWNATVINEAYAVLTDPARRASYDRDFMAELRRSPTAAITQSAAPRGRTRAAPRRCPFCRRSARPGADHEPDALCAGCGSPLHRATMRWSPDHGQRAIERLPRHHPLQIYTSWPAPQGYAGESRDVSLNGISFVTTELLVPQTIVKLDSEICKAVAEVAHIRVEDDGGDGLWLAGARFLTVLFPRTRGAFFCGHA
jgi:hypothetical protein